MPLTLRIESGRLAVIRMGAAVNGADAVVWHLDREPADDRASGPACPPQPAQRAPLGRPGARRGPGVFSPARSAPTSASGPSAVPRGVDLRQDGRTDVHVWSDAGFAHRVVAGPARDPASTG